MQIRSIQAHELPKLAAVGYFPSGESGFIEYVQAEWQTGRGRPEWCFVAEEGDQFIGRVLFSTTDTEAACYALHLPWEGDYLPIAEALFKHALTVLKDAGITHLESWLNSARPRIPEQRAVYDHLGMVLVQEKRRFWRESAAPLRLMQPRLTFRTLDEVGEGVFIDTLQRATEGTLDRFDQLERARLGEAEHAQVYFGLLRDGYQSTPKDWLLAYTPAGEIAGFVVGVRFHDNTAGTIGYIGVVPEQRGHGYIHELLAKVTANLRDLGRIVADTDSLNAPMIAAFERAGYQPEGTVWVFHTPLADML